MKKLGSICVFYYKRTNPEPHQELAMAMLYKGELIGNWLEQLNEEVDFDYIKRHYYFSY